MAQKLPSRTLTTPKGLLYYPRLFEKGLDYNGNPADHYTATLVLENGTDLKELKKAIVEVAKEMWPEMDVVKALKEGRITNPLKTDPEGTKGYPDGATFIKLKTKKKVGIVGPKLEPIDDPSDLTSGNLVRFTVSIFPYTAGGNKGVTIWMNNCQKCGDGKPFQRPASADFDTVEVADALEAEPLEI